MLARDHLGLRWHGQGEAESVVEPGRAILAKLDRLGWPTLTLGCAYLHDSEGLTERNASILAGMGAAARSSSHFILGVTGTCGRAWWSWPASPEQHWAI